MKQQAKANGQSTALALYEAHAEEAKAAMAIVEKQRNLRAGKRVGGANGREGFYEGEQAGRSSHRGAKIGAASGTKALGGG